MLTNKKPQPLKARRQDNEFIKYFVSLIPIGKEHAILSQTLADRTQHKSIRALQDTISILRNRYGYCICSNTLPPGGYYQSCDPAEIKPFIRSLENRGTNTLRAIDSAKEYLHGLEQNQNHGGNRGEN